jgi:MFS transporter, PPP family, 3-phenylpropionic acid transporter
MARKDIMRPIGAALGWGDGGFVLRMLYFLFYGAGAAWNPFFNVYLREIGLTGLQIGTLASIRPAVTLVGQPIAGFVADTWGRRRTLIVVLFMYAALLPMFAVSTNIVFLAFWVGVSAFLFSPGGTLIDSLVLDHVEHHPRQVFAQLRLWGAVGWGVMAYLVGWFINGRDLRLTFVIAAVLLVTALVLTFRLPKEDETHAVARRSLAGAGRVLRNKRLLLFLVLVALMQVGAAAVFSFVPVYLDEIGASSGMIGLAIGLQGLGELPLYLLAGAIISRIGPHRTIALSIAVFGIRSFLYFLIDIPALAAAVELTHGLSFSLFLVASVQYVDQLVPTEWRATGQSLLSTAYFGAGSILGNLWAGFLSDRYGIQTMFGVNAIILIALAVLALVVLRPQQGMGNRE